MAPRATPSRADVDVASRGLDEDAGATGRRRGLPAASSAGRCGSWTRQCRPPLSFLPWTVVPPTTTPTAWSGSTEMMRTLPRYSDFGLSLQRYELVADDQAVVRPDRHLDPVIPVDPSDFALDGGGLSSPLTWVMSSERPCCRSRA